MNLKQLNEKIRNQELYDYEISKKILDIVFLGMPISGVTYSSTLDKEYYPYDMNVTYSYSNGKTAKSAIEIKSLYRTEVENRKNCLIPKDKVNRVLQKSKEDNCNSCYYICIVNEIWAYVYNLNKLDYSSLEEVKLYLKNVNFSDDSNYGYKVNYILPFDKADYIVYLKDMLNKDSELCKEDIILYKKFYIQNIDDSDIEYIPIK